MVLMPLLSRLLTLLVILTMPLFLARLTLIPIKSLSICFRVIRISITTILKRRGCLTVPRLTLMSLIKMMLVRSEERFSRNAETDLVCRLLLEKKKHDGYIPRELAKEIAPHIEGEAVMVKLRVMPCDFE